MKLKSIVLSVMCMLLLVGCSDSSSSEKDNTTKATTTTTTTAHEDISFEATVIKADDGYITLVDAELSYGNGEKVGESRLECDDSVEIPSDIEEGDKLKVTVGQDFSIIETGPPIITNIKSIEKIS